MLWHCDATARDVVTLQRCDATVCGNGYGQRTMQRWRVVLELAATTTLCSDGKRRLSKFLFFVFFYFTVSRKKKKARKREKRQSFETCFLVLFVGITQAPSCNVNSVQE
jgi:hypothetical protein